MSTGATHGQDQDQARCILRQRRRRPCIPSAMDTTFFLSHPPLTSPSLAKARRRIQAFAVHLRHPPEIQTGEGEGGCRGETQGGGSERCEGVRGVRRCVRCGRGGSEEGELCVCEVGSEQRVCAFLERGCRSVADADVSEGIPGESCRTGRSLQLYPDIAIAPITTTKCAQTEGKAGYGFVFRRDQEVRDCARGWNTC